MDGQDEGSRRIYNQRDLTNRGGGQFGRHQEALLVEYQKRRKRTHPVTRPEDGLCPSPQLRRWRSCPTVDEVLTKAQFLSPLLYQIHCIGSVRFGFAHIYSERHPPNWDPTIGTICGKNLCARENDNRTRQGQTPKRERWWLTYWTANGELPRGSQLSGRLAPRAWPSPLPGLGRPANLTGGPR